MLTEGAGHAWFPLAEAIQIPDLMVFARDDLITLRTLVTPGPTAPTDG